MNVNNPWRTIYNIFELRLDVCVPPQINTHETERLCLSLLVLLSSIKGSITSPSI